MQRVVRAGNTVVLDVSNGVHTMDMEICLDETGPVCQAACDKIVRPTALCRGVTTENRKAGWSEEREFEWS